jgi:hypothetical protein
LARKPGKEGLDMTDITERAPARNSDDSRDQDRIPFHPLADLFPLMEGAEFDTLVADIKKNGLHYPIFLYEGKILDGRNRYRACLELGWEPATRNCDHHVGDPAGFVISRNIHRRHLTAKQRRELIAKLLKAAPEKSNRQIAETAKADDKTVATVRRDLEATAEIPQLEKTVGADGKARKQPANHGWSHERREEDKVTRATDTAVAAIDAPPGGKAKKAKAERNRKTGKAPSTGPAEKGNYSVAERAAIDLLDQLARIADDYEVELDPIDVICEHYDLVLLRKEDTPDEIADKVVEAIGNDRARDEAKKIGLSIKQSAGKPPLPDCGLCKGSGLIEGNNDFGVTFKTACPCVRRKGSDEDYRAKQQKERAEREMLEREMQQPFSFGVEAATKDGKVWANGVRLRSEEEAAFYRDLRARWELKKHGYQAWEGDPDKPCDITFEIKRYDEPPVMWFEKVKGRKHPVFCFPDGTCGLMNWRPIAGGECECKRCKKAQRQRKAHERWLEAFRKNNEIIKQAFAAGKISQKQRDEWDNSPCNKTPKWLTQLKKAAKKTDKAKSTKKAKFALADASDPGTLAAASPENGGRVATSPTRSDGSDPVQSAPAGTLTIEERAAALTAKGVQEPIPDFLLKPT